MSLVGCRDEISERRKENAVRRNSEPASVWVGVSVTERKEQLCVRKAPHNQPPK